MEYQDKRGSLMAWQVKREKKGKAEINDGSASHD